MSKDFNFKKPLYSYSMRLYDNAIRFDSETILLSEMITKIGLEKYIRENSNESDDYDLKMNTIFVKRYSQSPDDEELIKSMRLELLKMLNKYIKYLEDGVSVQKKKREDIFKQELRLLKLNSIDEDDD